MNTLMKFWNQRFHLFQKLFCNLFINSKPLFKKSRIIINLMRLSRKEIALDIKSKRGVVAYKNGQERLCKLSFQLLPEKSTKAQKKVQTKVKTQVKMIYLLILNLLTFKNSSNWIRTPNCLIIARNANPCTASSNFSMNSHYNLFTIIKSVLTILKILVASTNMSRMKRL